MSTARPIQALVTGATGFVGRALCRRLNEAGASYVALSRGGAPTAGGVATQALDLASGLPEPELLARCAVVYHLAGVAHQHAPLAAYRSLNYAATVALAEAAAAAGVQRFVFLSSVKAMGPSTGLEARSEQEVSAAVDPYGLSKWDAEEALRTLAHRTGMSVLILRPALVYGVGAKGNLDRIARAVHLGMPRPPELGGRSMVAVDDLVALLAGLLEAAPAGAHTWIVCDGQRYSARGIYDLLRQAEGMSMAAGWLPTWAWRVACSLADIRGAGAESLYQRMFGTELYDASAVRQALGWQPRQVLSDVVPAWVAAREARS